MNKVNVPCPACKAPLKIKTENDQIGVGIYEVACEACGYEGLIELEEVKCDGEGADKRVAGRSRPLNDLDPESAKKQKRSMIILLGVLLIAAFVIYFIQNSN